MENIPTITLTFSLKQLLHYSVFFSFQEIPCLRLNHRRQELYVFGHLHAEVPLSFVSLSPSSYIVNSLDFIHFTVHFLVFSGALRGQDSPSYFSLDLIYNSDMTY